MIHELKCWPEPFKAVSQGLQPYEVRKTDRDFQVGDILHLREFEPCPDCMGSKRGRISGPGQELCACNLTVHPGGIYTGFSVRRAVTYITPGGTFGLPYGLCVLGLTEAA